jgi:DNA invertase Pin-like site-specific DNA recombinase
MSNNYGRVVLYARVSSLDQHPEMQQDALEAWYRKEIAKDGDIPIIVDKKSGKTMDRPGWCLVDRMIEEGTVDTVVIWNMDRLGRTVSGLAALFEQLLARDVKLVSLSEVIDLTTASGLGYAHFKAVVAQMETGMNSERTRAGQEAAVARGGRPGGRPRGHTKAMKKKLPGLKKDLGSRRTAKEIAERRGVSQSQVYKIYHAMVKAGDKRVCTAKGTSTEETGSLSEQNTDETEPSVYAAAG